ncbi:metalloregulator ArsR/SmtB family transcription factor [Frankia sp. Mgl5]|uniref:Transcriptional regulator n=1 Tax=Parafrankia soli TaxID=2599596 RepID=A0A1S1PF44_9ACTN|nr:MULTISPECIES: metalloregulator ArsR/SmtB family transcription factor [Frankiaceae]MCK9929493.1 metalloregulator ArsR/SmtB family transcription factor [Frankia sp. Mgl5]OHV20300.1 transcriptional regulator [Parafrankia soli]TCJ33805.1 transcriptional regulator [Parafrankia sp. BMG5.11]SQD96252.1 Transcriptional regulator, ArsR family [Parafrankia sp. Ea1.12]
MVKLVVHGEVLARFGHALSDPTRARLLLVLRRGPSYPTELAEVLSVSRTNLSNHLACLRGCGLVVAVSEGRRLRYELADDALAHALDDLLSVVLAVDPDHAHGEPGGDLVAPAGEQPARFVPTGGSVAARDLTDLVDR